MDLSSKITPIAVSAVLALLLAASKKNSKIDENGYKVLRMPFFYTILGGIAAFGGFSILIYGLITMEPDEFIFLFLIFLFGAGLGIPLLLMGTIFKIVLTPDYIKQINMVGTTKIIKWNEIETIDFNKVTQELKIKSITSKIKAHMHLIGFYDLLNEIDIKTKFNQADLKIPKY